MPVLEYLLFYAGKSDYSRTAMDGRSRQLSSSSEESQERAGKVELKCVASVLI